MDKFEKLKGNFSTIFKSLPSGHFLIPDAYYTIGKLWIDLYEDVGTQVEEDSDEKEEKSFMKKAQHYYDFGVKAEKDLLPGFLPYFRLDKEIIEEFLEPSQDPEIFGKMEQEKFWL